MMAEAEVAVYNDAKYGGPPKELESRTGDDTRSENGEVEVLLTSGVASYGTAILARGQQRHRKLERLRSSANIQLLSNDELELKTNMFYHISNPIARWKADHSPPVKMILQLLQTICVITQVILLMHSPLSKYSAFPGETQDVFSNFFLTTLAQQPSAVAIVRGNPYNIYQSYSYTKDNMKSVLNNAGNLFYHNISRLMGAYDLVYDNYTSDSPRPVQVVLTQYSQVMLNPAMRTYTFNGEKNTTSFNLTPNGSSMFEQFLDLCGREGCLQRFLSMDVKFFLSNIRIIHSTLVHCFIVTITLSMASEGGGRILLTLTADQDCTDCYNETLSQSSEVWDTVAGFEAFLSGMILLLCMATFVLTLRALKKAFNLARAMGRFYHKHLNLPLTWSQRAPLFEYWHFINIVSDGIIVWGTIIKMTLDLSHSCDARSSSVDMVRILLGVGVVLQAAVVLRYISYFEQFNALSRALDIAFPRLLKFLVCVGILFLAFMLCGWVTLAPFHYKFGDNDQSFYTLFSMLNGDDLWNTFTGMNVYDGLGVFVFSQFFFVIFLILFIYAVLNLFISLIIQSYEESQRQDPHLKDEVRKFVFSGPLTPGGVALRDIVSTAAYVDPEIVKQQIPVSAVKVVLHGNAHGHHY